MKASKKVSEPKDIWMGDRSIYPIPLWLGDYEPYDKFGNNIYPKYFHLVFHAFLYEADFSELLNDEDLRFFRFLIQGFFNIDICISALDQRPEIEAICDPVFVTYLEA